MAVGVERGPPWCQGCQGAKEQSTRPRTEGREMKLLSKSYQKGGEGSIKVVPEEGRLIIKCMHAWSAL